MCGKSIKQDLILGLLYPFVAELSIRDKRHNMTGYMNIKETVAKWRIGAKRIHALWVEKNLEMPKDEKTKLGRYIKTDRTEVR